MQPKMKLITLLVVLLTSSTAFSAIEQYHIDPTHTFVEFKASHLGFSWLLGRFNEVEGQLNFDNENISNSSIQVSVAMTSLDTNHAKRNQHLKSGEYMDADKYPKASFHSSSVTQQGEDITILGELTFRSITKSVAIKARQVGAGNDPWGGYRRGYEGSMTLDKTDFGMRGKPEDAANIIQLMLYIECIRH